jgi:23S rRNA (pseudouridine1915-N3)-methyltransferase
MKTIFLLTGKTRNRYLIEGIRDYFSRIVNYTPFEIIEIPDLKNTRNMPSAVVTEKEADLIFSYIDESDFLVMLDEKGRQLSSKELAGFLEGKMLGSVKRLVFAVGGAYGFPKRLVQRADFILSLSRMTFPHQLVRLIFLEQFYRALTIIRGEPYHNA